MFSVPAMLMLNDVVSYGSDMTSGEDTSESDRAAQIIAENFQSSVSNSTLIIVLQSDDMTEADARNYAIELQQDLESADLPYLESVTSIYSYAQQVVYLTVTELGPQIYTTEEQVNQSAFLFWGVPAIHVQNWAGYYASDSNETNASAYAYSATTSMLDSYLASMDANTSAMVYGYYDAFASTWNYTASNASLVSNPAARGAYCVNAVAPTFIENLPSEASSKLFMTSVLGSFNMGNFNNQTVVHAFTVGMISSMAGISNTTFLQEVYDLGPTYNPLDVYLYSRSLINTGTLDTYPVAMPDQADQRIRLPQQPDHADDAVLQRHGGLHLR